MVLIIIVACEGKSGNHDNIEETSEELNEPTQYYNTGIYGGI
jgi:hypothetical protein